MEGSFKDGKIDGFAKFFEKDGKINMKDILLMASHWTNY